MLVGRSTRAGRSAPRWGIEAFPTLYLIDQQGVIRPREWAARSLRTAVESLMKEVAADTP